MVPQVTPDAPRPSPGMLVYWRCWRCGCGQIELTDAELLPRCPTHDAPRRSGRWGESGIVGEGAVLGVLAGGEPASDWKVTP